jgi:hypothetical protein
MSDPMRYHNQVVIVDVGVPPGSSEFQSLLGHSNMDVTERHYSPWIHARQAQLEADLERS